MEAKTSDFLVLIVVSMIGMMIFNLASNGLFGFLFEGPLFTLR